VPVIGTQANNSPMGRPLRAALFFARRGERKPGGCWQSAAALREALVSLVAAGRLDAGLKSGEKRPENRP